MDMIETTSAAARGDGTWLPRRVLLVSRHDYRTRWRANFHFIADAFRALGAEVAFVSTGFSALSKVKGDRRGELGDRVNRWEASNGIDCYLWGSLLHPFRLNNRLLDRAAAPFFTMWANSPCAALDEAAAAADMILVESDLSATLLPRLRRAGGDATIVYIASDLLDTIGAAPQIERALFAARDTIDHVVVVSRGMAPQLAALGRPISYVPHGIDPQDFPADAPSPYDGPGNAVSVGSMLFDRGVIEAAAAALPQIRFHLIGTPAGGAWPANVVEHGTLPFRETVPWLRHADIGIAPYRPSGASDYLSDSSMKLMQYGYLGLPAVCPDFAVGDHALRFGYVPGDAASVVAAFEAALGAPARTSVAVPSWTDVARRLARLGETHEAAASAASAVRA